LERFFLFSIKGSNLADQRNDLDNCSNIYGFLVKGNNGRNNTAHVVKNGEFITANWNGMAK
jgi:hypothetical protein